MYRVLIVDDEAISQDYLRLLIPWYENGFELARPAYSAEEARERLTEENIDIVIIDISMPRENGVVLSAYIAENYPKTLMLAVSSHDNYDYVRHVLKNGAYDYILKHRLSPDALLAALRSMHAILDGNKNAGSGYLGTHPLYQWVFLGGDSPYQPSDGICTATVARIYELSSVREDELRENIITSILSLIENSCKTVADVKTIFKDPDIVICFFLFDTALPQKKMLGDILLCNSKIRETIRQVYKMEYLSDDYPLMSGYRDMPRHIANAINNLSGRSAQKEPVQQVAMPLRDKRRFISALEEKNPVEATYLLKKIYGNIQQDNYSLMLSVTNDILDILHSAVYEDHKPVAFNKNNELEWARTQTTESIACRLCELCDAVLSNMSDTANMKNIYIKEALSIIEMEYNSDINQDKAAARLGLSPTYFSKLFKQHTGKNFTEILNKHRIDEAKLLLNNGSNIKETASKCGFKRYNYFIKVFKDYTGTTPAEYLKNKI